MDRISDWLRGSVRVELTGAFPAAVLNAAAAEGTELWNVESENACTLRLSTYEPRLSRLRRHAERGGCELKILRRVGGMTGLRQILRRPVLLLGLTAAALLLLLSSLFVWDIEVRGTEKLSRAQVLRALEDCGFGVGSFWPGLETELLRSEVMLKLPELGWMAVNVSGSRAVVAVVERRPKPELYDESDPVSLVASKAGLIRRMNVLAGRPAAAEGQIVTEGEVLIASELESLTGEPRRVRARGSVMADTWYELSAVCPREQTLKTASGLPHSRFAIILGKRRMNLYFGSGKTIDGCDKIISEFTLGIQGLFSTPVRIVRERFVPYETESGVDFDKEETARRLYALLLDRTEGQILSYRFSPGRSGELQMLTLRAHCTENIARPEEHSG